MFLNWKKNVAINILLLVTCTVSTVNADEKSYWLNAWDDSCYVDGYNTCRQEWYATPQGSHLVLWEVFVALERADSKTLFSGQSSLSQYGLLYPNGGVYESQYNEGYEVVSDEVQVDNMPLGLLKDTNRLDSKNYLGFTCAACHTGEVSLGDTSYYVEAGQSPLNMSEFFAGLVGALEANATGSKLKRFKWRYFVNKYADENGKLDYSKLSLVDYFAAKAEAEASLSEALASVSGFVEREAGVVENGPARLDAIGSIINQVFVHQAGLDENGESEVKPLSVPISYPYIWDVAELECVQTNCISTNPLTRNIGEVLGVFGRVNLNDDEEVPDLYELALNAQGGNTLFQTTAKIDNLYRLEEVLGHIQSPKWPNTFPALDDELLTEGKVVYQAQCASCHMDVSDGIDASELTAANEAGFQFTKVTKVPFTEVGTDPSFVLDNAIREEPAGILGAILQVQYPERYPEAPETLNALALSGVATGTLLSKHFESEDFIAQAVATFPSLPVELAVQYLSIEYVAGHVESQEFNPAVYRAKPLNGIAFTGPFLHNGSVRTLAELLESPENRASSFLIGSSEFDLEGVGYVSKGDFLFDTTLRGNSNAGHLYGVDLSVDDKRALLEYLKSL